MRKIALIGLFLMLLGVAHAQIADKKLKLTETSLTFEQFCRSVTAQYGITVHYPPGFDTSFLIKLPTDSLPIMDAFAIALDSTGFFPSEWNNQVVVLPDMPLIDQLPDYKSITSDAVEEKDDSKSLTTSEEKYLTGRKPEAIQTLRIGKQGAQVSRTKAKILGRILDAETGEPVYFATIFVEETSTGAVSDVNGFLNLMLKPGKYNVVFDFLGYEKKKYLFEVYSDGEFVIRLKKTVYQMEEFVVHGDKQRSMKDKDPGLDKIAMRTIKELPMLMGERDILKVSGTLPGIVSVGEGSAGLNVRGGGADQNAFFINKIPVYNTSHMFGFFPAFNSDIIKDFSIYKGHIPAEYGGRLSSVFNIITRRGNRSRFTAHGGISPLSANIVAEGPLKKDRASFILSARSTYSDWILQRIEDPVIRSSAAGFSDFSGGLHYDNQSTQIGVFFYHSYDRFRLGDINDYNYSNDGISLSVGQTINKSLRADFSLVGAQYAFKTTDKQEVSSAYEHAYQMNEYIFRADFKQILSDRHTIDFGANVNLYLFDRGKVLGYGVASLRNDLDLGKEKGFETALYISDSYDIMPRLHLTAGLRFATFSPTGPKKVYTYSPGLPLDPRFVNDSLFFGKNEVIKTFFEPDLRIALNYETDEKGSVKVAFNQMHQNMFMLNNTISVAPNTQWKLADYHLAPSSSNQVSVGVFRSLPLSGIEFSVEGYLKFTDNFPEFKDGASFLESENVETVVLQGKQQAKGIELFVKRSNRRLEGWLSYTYSVSTVQVTDANPLNSINNGEVYPANFDIPHVVNMVVNYHLNRRLTFSSIVTYQTGKPVTYPVSVYYVDGVPQFDYSKRNAYRIPDYFRVDLSMTVEGNLKRKKFLHSSFNISVYNVTGRQNPYAVYFNSDSGRIKSFQYSVIGVPILTATWIFKLGNYASE